ncbi:MAG: restriction endonuclease subunit S, partial [Ruminococcus sp.]|nr:restriction endonuclease subunit S [Ruminococcus sp.]
MRKMKDSGIEWIGEIPAHWTLARIGSLYGFRSKKVSDSDYPPLSVTKSGIMPQLETVAKTNAHDDRKLVKCGDFVINSRSDRRGSCGISKYDGSVSLINIVLYPIVEMNPDYYNCFFHTVGFADDFYKWGHGIVDDLWTTSWQDMKNIIIIVPPLEEQKKIASFLNDKCTEIDYIIAGLKKQTETLEEYKRSVITEAVTKGLNPNAEMKDSGIDYIGNMNAKWKLTKLRYICEKISRYFSSDAEPLICSNKGEVFPRGNNNFGLVSDNDKMFQGVHKGDLLIHGMDTWHGAIAVSDYDGKCTTVVHVCDSEQNKYFICYFLQMLAFKSVYKAISNGVRENTSDFRSWDKVGHIYITLPEINEQNRIANYIKNK